MITESNVNAILAAIDIPNQVSFENIIAQKGDVVKARGIFVPLEHVFQVHFDLLEGDWDLDIPELACYYLEPTAKGIADSIVQEYGKTSLIVARPLVQYPAPPLGPVSIQKNNNRFSVRLSAWWNDGSVKVEVSTLMGAIPGAETIN